MLFKWTCAHWANIDTIYLTLSLRQIYSGKKWHYIDIQEG